ncbi:GNAT family N-acetyltransferase [Paracoccaceae bacterium GXU_MW_L88]
MDSSLSPNPLDGIVPLLETERLRLRVHRADDLDDIATMWADPEVVRYIGGTPQTVERSQNRICAKVGHWLLFGYGYWLVETHAGEFVGSAGFMTGIRTISPPLRGIEMGWVISPAMHGKGYAFEACQAALDWLDDARAPEVVSAIVAPENTASINLATKLGFQQIRETEYLGDPCLVLERPRP